MLLMSTTRPQRSHIQRITNALLRHLDVIVPILVIGRCTWIFSMPLRFPDMLLSLAQDDFYYYLKTAQNLAWHHQATAFRHVVTNGYHPLYFLVLTIVSIFVRTMPGVYRFLWGLDTLSAAAIFFLTRSLFARLTSSLLSNALAVVITSLCVMQICFQMEVTPSLPLGFAFLLASFVTPTGIRSRRAAVMGLLGALTFLARLDAGLLVLLYLLGILLNSEYRSSLNPANVTAFLAACLPLPLLYLWSNLHFSHTLLPVSGMAKELRHGKAPSLLLFSTFTGTNTLLVLVALAGVVLAVTLRERLSAREKVLLFAVLLDPFLFYGLETLISDWPIWPWYFYALRFSAAGLAVCLCVAASRPALPARSPLLKRYLRSPALAGGLLLAALGKLSLANYNVDRWMVEIQHAAGVLDRFANTHPGAYAMGDRAGMFLITTPNPVLQAEGLVMDRTYLEHIRAQDDLRSVLTSYGVNYYVAFVPKWSWKVQFEKGCFHAMEPFLAGPSSMRMRSDFCGAPVYQFPGFDGVYVIYAIKLT